MKKSRAVIALILTAVITGLMAYTALVGFGGGHRGSYHNIKLGLDLAGGASITYEAVGDTAPTDEDMADTVYKLQQRVDQYSTEAQVYTEGSDRINIEIPGISGVEETNKILNELGQPGSLYFIRQTDESGNQNYQLGQDADGNVDYILTKDLKQIVADGDAVLEGTDVQEAKAGYQNDSMNNQQIVVSLTFTDEGKQKFADATTKAYAAGETIGIYYDGRFISVPRVQAAITDGRAVITGENTIEEAESLASNIRIGGLKVELQRLRSQIVGAQLGQDAIRTSKTAGILGFALVAILMIAIYWLPGLCATLALCIYILIVTIILNAFDVTLTLPGIAGILLSIGMAVDANVIIFARIREEIHAGKTVKNAMKSGYDKALSAIIDGNVTTLIAAAVLAFLGSGTIKGFAYTLAIGIVVSMFTALFVTRLLMNIFYALGAQDVKLYGTGRDVKTINFIAKRKIVFAISAVLIIAGFAGMAMNAGSGKGALNYSLDFVGGTSTNVTFNEDMSLDEINEKVIPVITEATGDSSPQVQKVAGSSEVIFKTQELDEEKSTALAVALQDTFQVDKDNITSETISSTISSEMKSAAFNAVIVALVLMLIYIWFRFKDARFGASSVICLAHDCLIVLAAYALIRISVGSTFIACMLTIVGYSINATIVVFDRVRENLRSRKAGTTLEDIVNTSVSQTLSRSIFTSLTTFFMVLALFIFGVASVKEFALPLMVGIVAGCWSSVCIAGPLWHLLRTKIASTKDSTPSTGSGNGDGTKGGNGGNTSSKKKNSNLSKKERKLQKQKEIEEKNKAKITV
ncbi:MAG: protein translocase subunit SecD [Lachnospiraceae bacterium]|nr:protein translocase subunit SecD [Lachnospiraceae bacterium]